MPPIREADRDRYQKWLESSGFPAASDPKIWEAICTNWIGFLSATGSMPKRELAPCRKVVTWEPRGSESPLAQTKRFQQDRKTRRCIQEAVWLQFDVLEGLAERWPAPVRTIVNQAGLGTEKGRLRAGRADDESVQATAGQLDPGGAGVLPRVLS